MFMILLRNIEEVRTFQGVLLRLTLAISECIIFLGIVSLLFIYNLKISILFFIFLNLIINNFKNFDANN